MFKRLKDIGVENTDCTRHSYRQLLFQKYASNMTDNVSGVILFHETLYQKLELTFSKLIADDCTSF